MRFFQPPNTKQSKLRILVSNTIWRNVVGFLPAIFWAILVAILSLSSVGMVPKFGWTDFTGFDKLGHMAFYCILALWLIFGFFKLEARYRNVVYWTAFSCVAFGICMELLQGMMHEGRQFEYPDILANVIGVLIAYITFNVFLKKKYYGNYGH